MIRIVLETHADLIEVVGEASDGETAVAQAELYPIDLVLMDIHLSQTNSTDATKQMRKLLPQMVIVGIASEYSPLLYNAMIAAGAVAFVRTEDAADLLFKTIVFAMCAIILPMFRAFRCTQRRCENRIDHPQRYDTPRVMERGDSARLIRKR